MHYLQADMLKPCIFFITRITVDRHPESVEQELLLPADLV